MIEAIENIKTKWLGAFPEHWQVLRIKNLFQEMDSRSETGSEELLSVSHYTGVTLKRESLENEDDHISNAESLVGYKLVQQQDLVINIMLAWNGSLGISPFNGITSPAYCVYRIKENNNPEYFGYLFTTNLFKAEFRRHSTGIIDSRLRLYSDKFFSIFSVVPPKDEQDEIVQHIKAQSDKINLFIQKKRKFIELLQEQKKTLIYKCITQGIKPNTPVKELDKETWFESIPKNWEAKKLKFISKIIYGISPKETTYNDEGIGTVLINGPVEYSDEDFGYTRELKWTTEPQKFAPKGALLFCLRGSTTGRLNICHNDVSIGRGVAAIVSDSNQDYLIAVMTVVRDFISNTFKGSTFPSVNSNVLNNILIPLPDIKEQKQIVAHIKTETTTIDTAIAKAEKEIELIKEYKAAMISEAVMGNKKINEKTSIN
ncbi:MAG: restriction endonuclease subunit S [Ferruginibacter sp.]